MSVRADGVLGQGSGTGWGRMTSQFYVLSFSSTPVAPGKVFLASIRLLLFFIFLPHIYIYFSWEGWSLPQVFIIFITNAYTHNPSRPSQSGETQVENKIQKSILTGVLGVIHQIMCSNGNYIYVTLMGTSGAIRVLYNTIFDQIWAPTPKSKNKSKVVVYGSGWSGVQGLGGRLGDGGKLI